MKLLIFDIDDTLCQSESQHQEAFVDAMRKMQIHDIDQDWGSYAHHTDSFILKKNYEANLGKDFSLDLIHSFELEMTELMLGLSPVQEISGALEFLEQVRKSPEYAMAFATGSLLKPALIKLRQAKLPFLEDLVVGSNQHYSREEIIKSAIDRARAHYSVNRFQSIISFGDGIWDLRAAQKLDLHFVGIGPKNASDFREAKLDFHIKDWTDLNLQQLDLNLRLNHSK